MSLEALTERYRRLAEECQAVAEQLASNRILKVLFRIGNYRTKIFILIYFEPHEWSTHDLSRVLSIPPGNVLRALKQLEKENLAVRVSRGFWKVNYHF